MNNTIKYLITSVATFCVVGGGYYYYTTTDSYKAKKLYEALNDDYTAEDCELIANLYPQTEYAQLAMEKKQTYLLMKKTWNSLCKKPSLEGFKAFKENFELGGRMQAKVEKKIDSVLWKHALNDLSEKSFQDYLTNNPQAPNSVLAKDIVDNIKSLPAVDEIKPTLEKNILEFLQGYGKNQTSVYMPTLADTLDFFLFHRDMPKPAVSKYIQTRVNSKGRRFDYQIISDISFGKSRMLMRGVGYSAEFLVKQTSANSKKEAINFKAKVLFNAQGKILYFRLNRDYSKLK